MTNNANNNQRVAVEANLSQVSDYLSQQGYQTEQLNAQNAGGQGYSAIVISGTDQNIMGVENATTNAQVINAHGLTPQDIAKQIQRIANAQGGGQQMNAGQGQGQSQGASMSMNAGGNGSQGQGPNAGGYGGQRGQQSQAQGQGQGASMSSNQSGTSGAQSVQMGPDASRFGGTENNSQNVSHYSMGQQGQQAQQSQGNGGGQGQQTHASMQTHAQGYSNVLNHQHANNATTAAMSTNQGGGQGQQSQQGYNAQNQQGNGSALGMNTGGYGAQNQQGPGQQGQGTIMSALQSVGNFLTGGDSNGQNQQNQQNQGASMNAGGQGQSTQMATNANQSTQLTNNAGGQGNANAFGGAQGQQAQAANMSLNHPGAQGFNRDALYGADAARNNADDTQLS